MVPFKFRLQKALEHRESLEEEAKKRLQFAATRRAAQEEAIRERQEQWIAYAARRRPNNPQELTERERFLTGLEREIERLKNELDILLGEEREARDAYLERRRDCETLEKLKEREQEAHAVAARRWEQRQSDEAIAQRRAA